MSAQFDQQVRAALLLHKGDWPELARESRVSYSWITKFAAGKIPNPGYPRLVRLNDQIRALARTQAREAREESEREAGLAA